MVRRIASLTLVLALSAVLVGLDPHVLLSAPGGNGEVDPTGLDGGNRITSIDPERAIPIVARQDVQSASAGAARWLEAFYLRLLLRSVGF